MTRTRKISTSSLRFIVDRIGCWADPFWTGWKYAWFVYETTKELHLCCKKTGDVFLAPGTCATASVTSTPGYFRTRAEAREVIALVRLQNKILVK